jgi:signal transduction histidine kinase
MAARMGDRIVEEQAALRRVATRVAGAAGPEEVFGAVAAEVGRLLDVDFTVLIRSDPPDMITVVGTWTGTGGPAPSPVGSRFPVGGRNVSTLVLTADRPARLDAYADVSGAIGDTGSRAWGFRSSVGVPISVDGRLWGLMLVAYVRDRTLPADTEERLAGFTELVATAIANAQARVELRGFAEEQAALRRMAMLVARAASAEEVFAAVPAEVGRVLSADITVLARYDADDTQTVLGAWSTGDVPVAVGTRTALGGHNVSTLVARTGRPARIDDYAATSGPVGEYSRGVGIRASVGVPISVDGRLWGVVIVASGREVPPAETEARLAGFTELVATALANAQARVELRDFAEEQAALRRVATLVAGAAAPEEVFDAVAAEVGRLLDVDFTILSRTEAEGTQVSVGAWSSIGTAVAFPVGTRVPLGGRNVVSMVVQTGRPARIDYYADATGPIADDARDYGFHTAVGVPIGVEGRPWGVMAVASARAEPLPPVTETRLAGFTELVGTAIANAEAQAALAGSRARIVAAADAARRRIERDLHDGAQQRLVSLALQVRAAQAAAPPEVGALAARLDPVVDELTGVLNELREIARGLHPAALAEGGLRLALKALARRSAVPVRLEARVDGRLPEPVELAAYYAVSEALTNTARHARATAVDVEVAAADGVLRVRVRDDGRGGADPIRGSGLVGLTDRIEALGGRLSVDSRPGAGTTVQVALPIGEAAGRAAAQPPGRWS